MKRLQKNIIFMHDRNHPESKPPHEGHEHGEHPHPPGPRPEGLPPHVLKELLELREKIGRLEGMMEILLKKMDH